MRIGQPGVRTRLKSASVQADGNEQRKDEWDGSGRGNRSQHTHEASRPRLYLDRTFRIIRTRITAPRDHRLRPRPSLTLTARASSGFYSGEERPGRSRTEMDNRRRESARIRGFKARVVGCLETFWTQVTIRGLCEFHFGELGKTAIRCSS